jgi:cobalamin biosynthesis protein CobD/CbiB
MSRSSAHRTSPDFLASLRQQTNYLPLRRILDVLTALSLFVCTAAVLANRAETPALLALLWLGLMVAVTLAARMFAHLAVDIADSLLWQSSRLDQQDRQAN